MNRKELEQKIIEWGHAKNIVDPIKQTLKTLSEAGQLAEAVCKSNVDEVYRDNLYYSEIENLPKIINDIGNIEICLTILKNQLALEQSDPLEAAWETKKAERGKL